MKKLFLFAFGLLLFISGTAYAALPVLNFSDLTSGPKTGLGDGLGSGAIVTIWGNGIGSSQGTSKVYVGNVEAAYVYEWTDATQHKGHPADLYTYHKMQVIAFSVPATAVDGANTIKVTVNGVDSNTLPFTVRAGNIYFVKTTGNDSTGNGSWSSPWRTLSYSTGGATSKMAIGGIVYAGDGVTEASGLTVRDKYGNASNPYAVISYPLSSVTVTGSIRPWLVSAGYWNFSKISVHSDSDGIILNDHARIIGNEITQITCADGQGGAIVGGNLNNHDQSNYPIAYGNYIHDYGGACTTSLHHGTYFSNRGGTPVGAPDIGWNYLFNGRARYGIHVMDEGVCGDFIGTTKIHNNVVKDQAGPGIHFYADLGGTNCITNDIDVWNNLLVNTGIDPDNKGWDDVAVEAQTSGLASHIRFYNNTIYGYGVTGGYKSALLIQGSGSASWIFAGTFEWVNNIVVNTISGGISEIYPKTPTVHSNNIWYSTVGSLTPPSWDTAPLTSNPLFVNQPLDDYRLQGGSPAKGAGTSTVGVGLKDLQGKNRPMPNYSIGAFEASVVVPASPTAKQPQ